MTLQERWETMLVGVWARLAGGRLGPALEFLAEIVDGAEATGDDEILSEADEALWTAASILRNRRARAIAAAQKPQR
jgi:hypothetical protein